MGTAKVRGGCLSESDIHDIFGPHLRPKGGSVLPAGGVAYKRGRELVANRRHRPIGVVSIASIRRLAPYSQDSTGSGVKEGRLRVKDRPLIARVARGQTRGDGKTTTIESGWNAALTARFLTPRSRLLIKKE